MRDTDADWRRFAESEPYHAVLTAPQFLRANLTPEMREAFFVSGNHDVDHVLDLVRSRVAPGFAPRSAIDFGCGVGRLVLAMARQVATVHGVDVAPAMLEEAARNCRERAPDADIRLGRTLPADRVDWVSSLLVFQHVPPARGIILLRDLLGRLEVGGVASLQFTACRTPQHLHGAFDAAGLVRFDGERLEVLRPEADPAVHMDMYDYDMTAVLMAYAEAGVAQSWVQHVDHGGHHAFWVIGRRER